MKKLFVILLLGVLSFTLTGCQERYTVKSYTYYSHFNTTSTVQILYDVNSHTTNEIVSCFKGIDSILLRLDKLFNIQDTSRTQKTDLMKVNESSGVSPVQVDGEVIEVLNLALDLSEESIVDGVNLYNPTIGSIWQKWDFINKGYNPLYPQYFEPLTEDVVNKMLPLVDLSKIEIDEYNSTIYLQEAGMVLDLGSIVKGYACDKIKNYLIEQGISKAVINVGGNIVLLGSYIDSNNEDTSWDVKIRTPFYQMLPDEQGYLGVLKLYESSVVTTGTYEKYILDEELKMYHHILDPRTGFPVDNGLTSVTVISNSSTLGDGLSTMLFTLGLEKAFEYVNNHEGIEIVVVQAQEGKNKVYVSSGLEEIFIFNEELKKINYSYEGVL